jgi:hypothetical protein
VPSFLKPQGRLVLISPYSWLEEYTNSDEWFGAQSVDGKDQDSFDALKEFIDKMESLKLVHRSDTPFLIREHERKFQYGVSDVTIWEKI